MGLPTTSPPSGTDYEIWVKGSPEGIDKGNNWSDKGKLGDCPFSQRSMMTFEELGLKYKPYYIDEQNMPEWIKEVPGLEGKQQIPFVHEVASDKWMGDSDKFLGEITEKQENGKKVGTPDSTPQVGTELMPKFMGFMRSKPGKDEDEKKGELLSELEGIDGYLKEHGGPYIGGKSPNATDLRLAPQLNHVRIGADEIKGYKLPSDKLSHLLKWHEEMKSRPSWKNTAPDSEQYVRDGWQVKMKMMDKMEKEQN